MANCSQCGAPLDPGAATCKYCGEAVAQPQVAAPQPQAMYQQPQQMMAPPPQQVVYQQQPVYVATPQMMEGINPGWPIKSKIAAGILAILLGSLGVQKFYLGQTGKGILCILFCWTYIPAIIGIIDGITILTSNDHNFQVKYQVRIQ